MLDYVKEQVSRIVRWGYRLIKHDFTTYDMFGLWGKDMGFSVTDSASSFSDRGITSAEAGQQAVRRDTRGGWRRRDHRVQHDTSPVGRNIRAVAYRRRHFRALLGQNPEDGA